MSGIFTHENVMFMLSGMKLTLEISAAASVIAIVIGTALALVKTYARGAAAPLRWLAGIYVEIFRCTPQLLWILMFRFFVKGGGFNLGVVSLSVVSAPYICEIVRGGLNNVPKGQIEAGHSQGFRFSQILRLIILPQTFRAVTPALFSQITSVIKSTSLLASINIFEYLFTCNTIMVSATTVSGIFAVYAVEAAGYFLVNFALSLCVKAAGRKMRTA